MENKRKRVVDQRVWWWSMKYLESFFLLNGTGTVRVQDQSLCFQMIINEMLTSTRIFTAGNTFPVHLLILLYKVKIDIYNRYDLHDLHRSQQISVFATDVPGSKLILLDYGCNAVLRQTAVTAYFTSKQLLLFVFELQDSLLPSSTGILTTEQRQTAVTAHLYSKHKQLLLFIFELQDSLLPSSTGMLTAVQRQTAVTLTCKVSSYCCLSLSCRILFCHRVLAYWRPCKDKQQ